MYTKFDGYLILFCCKDYISQTPFEIYETTNGGNFPVGASGHFLAPTEG